MQLHEEIKSEKFGGIFVIEVIRDGKNGPEVIQRRVAHNTVVNAGKKQLVRRACGLQTKDFDHFRIGTSGATVNSAQANVLSQLAESLKIADSKTIVGGRTLQLVISYPSAGGITTPLSADDIQEVVILNQGTSPGGDCLARCLFSSVNKAESDKLRLTYSLRIT